MTTSLSTKRLVGAFEAFPVASSLRRTMQRKRLRRVKAAFPEKKDKEVNIRSIILEGRQIQFFMSTFQDVCYLLLKVVKLERSKKTEAAEMEGHYRGH